MNINGSKTRLTPALVCSLALLAVIATANSAPAAAATCQSVDPYGNTVLYPCGPDDPNYPGGDPIYVPPPKVVHPLPPPDAPITPPPPPAAAVPAPRILSVSAKVVSYGQKVTFKVRARPGRVVALHKAAMPSHKYKLVRAVVVPSSGVVTFTGINPGTSSRFHVRERSNPQYSKSITVVVRPRLTTNSATR